MTATSTLFDRVVRGLHSAGQTPEVDEELRTITFDLDSRSTVAVVMGNADAVVFYSVWPQAVPTDALVAMSEYVMRANTELYTAALELDLDSGILSARTAVACAPLAATDDALFGAVLTRALTDAGEVAAAHHDGIAAVAAGGSPIDALAARTR